MLDKFIVVVLVLCMNVGTDVNQIGMNVCAVHGFWAADPPIAGFLGS